MQNSNKRVGVGDWRPKQKDARSLPWPPKRENMQNKEWSVRELIEALKRFPLDAKVFYEMGPNGLGTIGKAQYVKARGASDDLGVLLDR
jgi:hypothetical protein